MKHNETKAPETICRSSATCPGGERRKNAFSRPSQLFSATKEKAAFQPALARKDCAISMEL